MGAPAGAALAAHTLTVCAGLRAVSDSTSPSRCMEIPLPAPIVEKAYLRNLGDRFLDLLFPPRCIGCRRPGTWLCADCLGQIPRICPPVCARCGTPVAKEGICSRCQHAPLRIEGIRAAAYFDGVLRDAVHHLKYRRRKALAEPLGSLMAACWKEAAAPADVVVPVPLHAARLRERGYNQAALLARVLARQAGMAVNEQTLVRQRATAAQVGLDLARRQENVRGAFCCVDSALANAHVLLVDDVCTTGATLEACALALYDGGALQVHALTLARAC